MRKLQPRNLRQSNLRQSNLRQRKRDAARLFGGRVLDERGSNAIEFVLCLPVWIAIVVAIADFGWLFYHQTTLDAAANLGCRAGSLIDPGDADQYIAQVQQRATDKMTESLESLGGGACPLCTVNAYTVGSIPGRSLRCDATRPLEPLVGFFLDERLLASKQIARLEWQREAAPE